MQNWSSSSQEMCPIFFFDALRPKKKFNENLKFDNDKIFSVERNLLSIYGFPQYGVHCNGWFKKKKLTFFHMAKRSNKLKKFPGMVDNFVAGGQPCGLSIRENLYKEGLEEAGLDNKIFKKAKYRKSIHYCHNVKNKLNSSVIFVYDIEIDENIKLYNKDGEVESFFNINTDDLHEIFSKKLLKPNCIIPIAEFFVRVLHEELPKNSVKEIKTILSKND